MNEFSVMAASLALIAAALWKRDAGRAYRWLVVKAGAWRFRRRVLGAMECATLEAVDYPQPTGGPVEAGMWDDGTPGPRKRRPRRKRNPGT